jgi:PIN domain nuclease of toxin-antitoxin system
MFEESRKTIETHAKTIAVKDEQQMAVSLVRASELRRDYCLGRITLEEAKIF